MSTIESRINHFISDNKLSDTDEFREVLSDFVSGCWGDHFKIVMKDAVPEETSKKIPKADKIEDPTECHAREDLRNCTASVLNEFSKKNNLRVGGNKKEIMDRVWRFLQGENSDDDISPRNKPKTSKKVTEKHECFGCTANGSPCAVAATEEFDGKWFCWRHEKFAADIIAKKIVPNAKTTEVAEKTKSKTTEVAEKTKSKTTEVAEKTKSKTKPSKPKAKKPEPEPEPEPESEPESEHETEELETDDE